MFHKNLLLILASVAVGYCLVSAAPPQKKSSTPVKKTAAPVAKQVNKGTVASKAPGRPAAKYAAKGKAPLPAARRATYARPTPGRTTAARGRGPQPVAPRRYYGQQAPTADRTREIQQALIAKGYLKTPEPNGAWDSSSTDAMKRFQHDQNLPPTGKVSSLSLIALGLGPKRNPTSAALTNIPTP